MMIAESRPLVPAACLVHPCSAGVFERFPRLKYGDDRGLRRGIPPLLDDLDAGDQPHPRPVEIGELKYPVEDVLRDAATEYFPQNAVGRRQLPAVPTPRRARDASGRPLHVGERLPPRRGHLPVHP